MCGWTEHNDELRKKFVALSNCDIFCVSETHLLEENTINVEGYIYYGHNRNGLHKNAPKGSGGVGIFVRNTLLNEYVINIADKSYEGILGIKLQHKVSEYTMLIYTCYLAPENSVWGRDSNNFYSHLLSQVYYNIDAHSIVICGDLNSRIGALDDCIDSIDDLPDRTCIDTVINQHGRSLIDFLHESRLCILNGRLNKENDGYTCRNARGTSVVDYFLIDHDNFSKCKNFKVETCIDIVRENSLQRLLNSKCKIPDHGMLSFELITNVVMNSDQICSEQYQSNGRRYFFNKINENFMETELCKQAIVKLIDVIQHNRKDQDNLDKVYESFTEIIVDELNRTVPFVDSSNVRKRYKPRKAFWNDELNNLLINLNDKEKALKKCHNRVTKKLLFNELRVCQQNFDRKFRYYERKFRKEISESIEQAETQNPKLFWEHLNSLGPRKNKKIILEVYDNNNDVTYDINDVKQKWESEFSSLYNDFNKGNCTDNKDFKELLKNDILSREQNMKNPLYQVSYMNRPFDEIEIRIAVMKSKTRKAVGVDQLPNEVYKNDTVINILMTLFQLCFDIGKIPSIWRKAMITPILKDSKFDQRVPLNYRGISLLCCSAKLYSSVLNRRIERYLDDNNLLVDEQNGFRKGRSCEDHIFVLDSIVRNRLNENLPTFAAFIDLQKAFDCVNREYLYYKLLKVGIEGKTYFAIKNMYSLTESCVKINNNVYTQWFQTNYGVRQGDSLSPTLFSIFINDLANDIKESLLGVEVNGRNISILLYADDIVIVAPNEHNLQAMLSILNTWSNKWNMFLNNSKSKIVHFRSKKVKQSEFEFKVGNKDILYVNKYKYLGVTMDENLSYEENCDILAKSAGRALGSVISKYKNAKNMGYKTYTKLFESCVAPIMEYASGVWGYDNFKHPDSVQFRATRCFLGVHKFAPLLSLEGDMGWLLPQYKRWINIIRLWNKLITLPADRLTKHIFLNDIYLAMSNNKVNWCKNVHKILNIIGLEDLFYNRLQCDIDLLKKRLFVLQQDKWYQDIQAKPKLRFYKIFKSTLNVENYVSYNLEPIQRSFIAQLRAGILPLFIETGRFYNIKLEHRICTLCNMNKIENEIHFLFECVLYNDLRTSWLINVCNKNTNFNNLSIENKLKFMFENCFRNTAKYVVNCFNRRKDIIFSR